MKFTVSYAFVETIKDLLQGLTTLEDEKKILVEGIDDSGYTHVYRIRSLVFNSIDGSCDIDVCEETT